ncbi:hypothetical protein Sp245p_26305 (plasmid) [Azospirillum baldaniorum]|uniref:Uncharacterized protein n=1 Tax=Azospirillum baldaniorum TaxID=1064539 RepID=A0A9P1JZR5_9PROT|nr:hypothetical protein Sp245p_22515 [Azospirillum baldaniorum]AWJ93336.1 hypothetical protein Sp245p_26305 [Azospirillum baldaniorum]CCD02859.1 conserved protein of unknown function [Azospirillum baldaniorum]
MRAASLENCLAELLPLGAGPFPPDIEAARDRLCTELVDRGVTPVLSESWADLQALNARHRESWFPLLPKPPSAPAFWIGLVDGEGEVVATYGVVLVDCAGSSFGARLMDLSALHDPGSAPADEWVFVASEGAHDAMGPVAWIVAGWIRPDWRGSGLFHRLGALTRLLALCCWPVGWVVGLVDPETVPVWRGRGVSRHRLEDRPGILYRQSGVGRLPLHFMRWSREDALLSLGIRSKQAAEAMTPV